MGWFEVDKEGLAQILERRGKAFVVFELLQNAWDENVTSVEVSLDPVPGRPAARLIVVDDAPEGFKDLKDAYTLFAPSGKKAAPEKRGRFNLGEKLVLALCENAEIASMTGTVRFTREGRRHSRRRRFRGSRFAGILPMTREEFQEVCRCVQTVIPPPGRVHTFFNGEPIPHREPLRQFVAPLPTEIADEEGRLRRTTRTATISVYEPFPDEEPTLYEMGIPIVPTGERFHVDVGQKVPLSLCREGVPPAYLQTLRVLVLNELHALLPKEELTAAWVNDATDDKRCSPEAVRRFLDAKFGEKRVVYDPSDAEANKLAVSKGYQVIPGGALSKRQWENVKTARAALPAGQVTPSQKTVAADEEHKAKGVSPSRWTDGMKRIVAYSEALAEELLGFPVTFRITDDPGLGYYATYTPEDRLLRFNLHHLKRDFFEHGATEDVNELLIHEFGHHYSLDHLSSEYHDGLCRLGAQLARLALEQPNFFAPFIDRASAPSAATGIAAPSSR